MRPVLSMIVVALTLTACGGDDGGGDAQTPSTPAPLNVIDPEPRAGNAVMPRRPTGIS